MVAVAVGQEHELLLARAKDPSASHAREHGNELSAFRLCHAVKIVSLPENLARSGVDFHRNHIAGGKRKELAEQAVPDGSSGNETGGQPRLVDANAERREDGQSGQIQVERPDGAVGSPPYERETAELPGAISLTAEHSHYRSRSVVATDSGLVRVDHTRGVLIRQGHLIASTQWGHGRRERGERHEPLPAVIGCTTDGGGGEEGGHHPRPRTDSGHVAASRPHSYSVPACISQRPPNHQLPPPSQSSRNQSTSSAIWTSLRISSGPKAGIRSLRSP